MGNILPDSLDDSKNYIIKSIDTALFYSDNEEYFTYSNKVYGKNLKNISIEQAPVFFQEYIEEKVDLRVTVIGNKLFPVSITKNYNKIDGDWRTNKKEDLKYTPVILPTDIEEKLIKLMNILNLGFGGIDLVKTKDDYYFIEVNPTGEWGWLTSTAKLPIDKEIVNFLEDHIHREKIY